MPQGLTPPRPGDWDVAGDLLRHGGKWVAELFLSAGSPETCWVHERIRMVRWLQVGPVQVALAEWSQNCIRKTVHLYNTHTANNPGNRKASVLQN